MIGIVTVLYNSSGVLDDFFRSLEEQTYKDFVLYIIDNNSPDNSLEVASVLSKAVTFRSVILPQKENWGVAKGNNIGIQKALEDGCDFILLSNNDIELQKNTIQELINGIYETKSDIIVPKIYFWKTNVIWAAGGAFCKGSGQTIQYGENKTDSEEYNSIRRIYYAPTCFALIKAGVFNEVGMMDENYFVYYDDTDFMWRLMKSHKLLYYYPKSVLWHKESTSTGKRSFFSVYYLSRNVIYFTYKNKGLLSFIYVLIRNVLAFLFRHTKEWNSYVRPAFKGLCDGVKLSLSK